MTDHERLLPEVERSWWAPLCRRSTDHETVEHNDESLAKLGKRCACVCHGQDGERYDPMWRGWREEA